MKVIKEKYDNFPDKTTAIVNAVESQALEDTKEFDKRKKAAENAIKTELPVDGAPKAIKPEKVKVPDSLKEMLNLKPLNENWAQDRYNELMEKGRDNWDEDDVETYNYIENIWAEKDYYDQIGESLNETDIHPKFKKDIKNQYKSWDKHRDKLNTKRAEIEKDLDDFGVTDKEQRNKTLNKLAPKARDFEYEVNGEIEIEDYPYYVTEYKEAPHYHPEEGGYYVASREPIASKGFNDIDSAKEYAESVKKEYESYGDEFEPFDDGAISGYRTHSEYIGNDFYICIEPHDSYLYNVEKDYPYESLKEDFDLTKLSTVDKYRFLDRLRSDCDYIIKNQLGKGGLKHLWTKNLKDQIESMRYLYNSLEEKPEWISKEDIDNYEKELNNIQNESLEKSLNEDINAENAARVVREAVKNDFGIDVDVATYKDAEDSKCVIVEFIVPKSDCKKLVYDELKDSLYKRFGDDINISCKQFSSPNLKNKGTEYKLKLFILKERKDKSKIYAENLNDSNDKEVDVIKEEISMNSNKYLDLYQNIYEELLDGANADVSKNIKMVFDKVNGHVNVTVSSPTYIKYDGIVGDGYTVSGSISLNDLNRDCKRLAEDLTMAYYRIHGGKGYNTMSFMKALKDGSFERKSEENNVNEDAGVQEMKVIKEAKTVADGTNKETFKFSANKKLYVFNCSTVKTRNGFAHLCDMMCDFKVIVSVKANYLNRTWEAYNYQSVLMKAVEKSDVPTEDKDILRNKIRVGKQDDSMEEQDEDAMNENYLKESFSIREYTDKLYDMVEEGLVDAKEILGSLMYWCSEDDVKRFMEVNDLLYEDEDESEEVDDDETEDVESEEETV